MVKLSKVTLYIIHNDSLPGGGHYGLDQLIGDCRWSDDDLLNQISVLQDVAQLEAMVAGQPVNDLFEHQGC